MLLKELQNKRILILGFGKEGIDNYLALRKLFPEKVLGIADKKTKKEFDKKTKALLEKDKKLKSYFGKNYLGKAGEYDLIVKTPGISPKELGSLDSLKITTQTEIFFDNFPGLIIGITGTKGKGTASSLIYEILKNAGLPVFLGGNIGKPVFQYLLKSKPGDVFVYELSSHQLQNLKKSPPIAVFLNLFPDHLDYYRDFQEYRKAKANITIHQTKNDFLIYNSNDQKVRAMARKSRARKIPFSLGRKKYLFKTIKPEDINLKGDFNLSNVMAAVETAEIFQIEPAFVRQAVKRFRGLPHRLEFVGRHKGIEFYNDSMSTIPEVSVAALAAFPKGQVGTLMVGGSDKGSDYSQLAKKIIACGVENVAVLGKGTGQTIASLIGKLKTKSKPKIFFIDSMEKAVGIAFSKTKKGKVCLLSPGSASFNIFKDYQDRGNQFKKYAETYDNSKNL